MCRVLALIIAIPLLAAPALAGGKYDGIYESDLHISCFGERALLYSELSIVDGGIDGIFTNIRYSYGLTGFVSETGKISSLKVFPLGKTVGMHIREAFKSDSGNLNSIPAKIHFSNNYCQLELTFLQKLDVLKDSEGTLNEYKEGSIEAGETENGISDDEDILTLKLGVIKDLLEKGLITEEDASEKRTNLLLFGAGFKSKDSPEVATMVEWLRSVNLSKYEKEFLLNDITMDILPELTDTDLKEMGIKSVGARKRILRAIKEIP